MLDGTTSDGTDDDDKTTDDSIEKKADTKPDDPELPAMVLDNVSSCGYIKLTYHKVKAKLRQQVIVFCYAIGDKIHGVSIKHHEHGLIYVMKSDAHFSYPRSTRMGSEWTRKLTTEKAFKIVDDVASGRQSAHSAKSLLEILRTKRVRRKKSLRYY